MGAGGGFVPQDGPGLLAGGTSGRRPIPRRVATPGLLVELTSGSFIGAVVTCGPQQVVLEDRRGRRRSFALSPGAFLVDDVPVDLVPPPTGDGSAPAAGVGSARAAGSDTGTGAVAQGPDDAAEALGRTPSGSVPVADPRARTARASRLWVEGIHDAELLERVWGDDLRAAAVVVEPLHGADDLAVAVRAFRPAPHRRLGILLDHLVAGSKESRLAAEIDHADVLVVGHPFVDVWAAISPSVLGRSSWPEVPRGEPYKDGFARRLGFADRHEAWRALSRQVRTWRDLDRSLIQAVERLLDHVTGEDQPR